MISSVAWRATSGLAMRGAPSTSQRTATTILAARPTTEFVLLDLKQSVGTMFRGDAYELLAVRVAQVDFIETTRRVAGPADHRERPARTSCAREPGWVLSSKQARDSAFKRIVMVPLYFIGHQDIKPESYEMAG